MRSPKYVESNVLRLVYRLSDYNLHKDKLNHMTSDKSLSRKPQLRQMSFFDKIKNNKASTVQAKEQLKFKLIERENQQILSRLAQISYRDPRKTKSVGMKVTIKVRTDSANSNKSLNFTMRKKQAYQIATDNATMMHRILTTPSTVNSKSYMERNFQSHLRIKDRITKMNQKNQSRLASMVANMSMSRDYSQRSLKKNSTHEFMSKKQAQSSSVARPKFTKIMPPKFNNEKSSYKFLPPLHR